MNQLSREDAPTSLRNIAEEKGVATASVSDGRIFLFKSDYLRQLLLSTLTNDLKIGLLQSDGSIKETSLPKAQLQAEMDTTDKPFLIVFVSDKPIMS